jgi:glycosyltransferase involved in cell wall biosynthesis
MFETAETDNMVSASKIGGWRISGTGRNQCPAMPLVTVITTVLNRNKYIRDALESVASQTYRNIEHIVIDGGSTDGTVGILREFDDHIAYWRSEPDGSMYEGINKGLHQARGDIITILNSDDRYIDTYVVQDMVDQLQKRKDAGGVYGDTIKDYGNRLQYKRVFQVDYFTYLLATKGTFIPHGTLFVRRKCADLVGDYDTSFKYSSDYDYILRLLKACDLKYVHRAVSYFRVHGESITASGLISPERWTVLEKHGYKSHRSVTKCLTYYWLWVKYYVINLAENAHMLCKNKISPKRTA